MPLKIILGNKSKRPPRVMGTVRTSQAPITKATPQRASMHDDIASNNVIHTIKRGGRKPDIGRGRKMF